MQVNYDALNVVWELVDIRPSDVIVEYRCFPCTFPSGTGYLLSLKTILIPRKAQKTNTCSKSTKDILEQGMNYFES